MSPRLIRQQRLGVVLRSFTEIAQGIAPMLDPEQLAEFRSRAVALNNQAVFEIPAIVDELIGPRQRKRRKE